MATKGKLYTFLHESGNLSAKFLSFSDEDKENGLAYFDLCFLHLLAYFKDKEQMCAYFDAEGMPVNYKIEASPMGIFRSLLMVSGEEFNPLMTGIVRILKILPKAKTPSQSIIRIEEKSPRDMVQEILGQSYQIESVLLIEALMGQSLLISALPQKDPNQFNAFALKNEELLTELSKIENSDSAKIIDEYEKKGFKHLTTLDLSRSCPCSKDYIIQNISKLSPENINDLFEENETTLEANCDYCQKVYVVSKQDLARNRSH